MIIYIPIKKENYFFSFILVTSSDTEGPDKGNLS